MKKFVLDTCVLISWWRRQWRKMKRSQPTPANAMHWARELVAIHNTDAIVTPVYIEMIAGTTSKLELELTQAFLEQFRCIDGGNTLPADWREAIRLSRRIPNNRKARDLGDCLIRAIANRLKHDVETTDQDFVR